MSYTYERRFILPHNTHRYQLDKFETQLKRNLFTYSIVKNTTQEQTNKFISEVVSKGKTDLKEIRKGMTGINWWAFFGGIAVYHLFVLYKNKRMLYEMESKAVQHLATCFGVGLASGLIVGLTFSRDVKAYFKYSKLNGKLNKLNSEMK